jgi:hypothetical protein
MLFRLCFVFGLLVMLAMPVYAQDASVDALECKVPACAASGAAKDAEDDVKDPSQNAAAVENDFLKEDDYTSIDKPWAMCEQDSDCEMAVSMPCGCIGAINTTFKPNYFDYIRRNAERIAKDSEICEPCDPYKAEQLEVSCYNNMCHVFPREGITNDKTSHPEN